MCPFVIPFPSQMYEYLTLMKLAIGYNGALTFLGTFFAKKNSFPCQEQHESWENMIREGLAERAPTGWDAPECYRLTKDGLDFLSTLLDITIKMKKRR